MRKLANSKNLNLLLLAGFLAITGLTLRKWLEQPSSDNAYEALSPLEQLKLQDSELITEKQDQRFHDHDRLARNTSPLNDGEMTPEQVEVRYEELKYDRAVEALRTRHTEDLRRVLLDGIDFTVLPEGSHQRLREIAEEEGMLFTFERLLR